MSETVKVRFVREFLEPLTEIPEELRELLTVDLGARKYVDLDVPPGMLQPLRDLAERQVWAFDKKTQPREIRAAFVTRVLLDGKLRAQAKVREQASE